MANLELFEEKLNCNLTLSLSAKEMAERIVIAALEAEYGKAFTMSRGFAKMVNALAEALITNPDLRQQALSVASLSIRKSRDNQKNIRKGT